MARTLGLRGKSVLALFATSLLVLLLAGLGGWQVVQSVRHHLGTAYTSNLTLLKRERILAPVSRDLALALRLADSEVMRQWLLDENNPQKRSLAMREFEGYRHDFDDKSYFVGSAISGNYYFNDTHKAHSDMPRYQLRRDAAKDAWFYSSLKSDNAFNLNVDPDPVLGVTKVWFNVIVRNGQEPIGMAGTGLDLTAFLRDFVGDAQRGVTPMIVDIHGGILAHPNRDLIAINTAAKAVESHQSLYGLLAASQDMAAARAALSAALASPGAAQTFSATLDGKRQIMAVSYIPELKWHVLTAVDIAAAEVIDTRLLGWAAALAAALIALSAAGFVVAVDKMVLKPLLQLKQSARQVAAGNYEVALPADRNDEIGELTTAFASMADKIRRHTDELEESVRERTRELLAANREMAAAHKKISDSIAYASLIQRAILPDRQLDAVLGENHFVLWRPRDVVGGDFYVCRHVAGGCLVGVVDCAGHGVPGAFMTMLAHGVIDQAINEAGAADPAGILIRTDQIIRAMLHADARQRDIATNLDAGFAHIDFASRRVTFAGAKIALYWCDGAEVGSIRGGRRAAGDRQPGEYRNESTELLASRTFYLTTDGFLDQAGGEKGYGFGNARFADMLRRHAMRPLHAQREAFTSTLTDYQGQHPQRDDITIVCFRFGDAPPADRSGA